MDLLQKFRYYTSVFYYRHLYINKFFHLGIKSVINCPLKIDGANNISIGNRVTINYRTWLAAMPIGDTSCLLEIGNGTIIGNYNHIYATKKIIIGEKVLTADKVYISDNMHGYENINIPVMDQNIVQNNIVEIGAGSWIGENACILGCKIGKNCIIGSNAVVTKDIPDFSIAVGVPAKVIKKYSLEENRWINV